MGGREGGTRTGIEGWWSEKGIIIRGQGWRDRRRREGGRMEKGREWVGIVGDSEVV